MVALVKVGMFCTMVNSDFAEHGVKKGDLVYVAGESMMQRDEVDPYTFTKMFIVAYTKDKHVLNTKKPFYSVGQRLKPVSRARQERLEKVFLEDFQEVEEEVETTN